MFDVDPGVIGMQVGDLRVRDFSELEAVVAEEEIVVGVLAVPADAAQEVADRLVEAGVKIIFNYSERCCRFRPRSPCIPRAPRSTSSTRSTST